MTPFPFALQTLRPTPADVLPERPWWRNSSNKFGWCVRSDGKSFTYDSWATRLYRAEQIDASEPLPFPGLRYGQVWNKASGGQFMIYDPATLKLAEQMIPNGAWFLLADPQCPHLAPWAPVEGK